MDINGRDQRDRLVDDAVPVSEAWDISAAGIGCFEIGETVHIRHKSFLWCVSTRHAEDIDGSVMIIHFSEDKVMMFGVGVEDKRVIPDQPALFPERRQIF